ncbi:GntR family transcriptional regulator [Diaphorobacter caeni]|uniref:GntR family transcriptional regulator n=1 Tax=Diaphorobacter caeni TaxID=2784387 RepID=UPI00188FBB78|nr:GntR family transcriptional regulator [Diaphorobacter caeni]MBF5007733.1 GntR family transcriptional regulator [Diaphorobacter caeni]
MAQRLQIEKSKIARYLQLATLFRSRITSGQWAVDERIPNVDDLALEFNVARGTIREALDVIAEEGLIERFRAKGSFVRKSPAVNVVHHLETDWNSLIGTHKDAKVTVLDHVHGANLPHYALSEGTPVNEYEMMRRLHKRDGIPYLLGRFYLDRELYQLATPKQFRTEPVLAILHNVANERIAHARQTLTIASADLEMAELLDIPLNAPVAKVFRVAVDHAGNLIYVSEGFYRGDMVKLEIKLR